MSAGLNLICTAHSYGSVFEDGFNKSPYYPPDLPSARNSNGFLAQQCLLLFTDLTRQDISRLLLLRFLIVWPFLSKTHLQWDLYLLQIQFTIIIPSRQGKSLYRSLLHVSPHLIGISPNNSSFVSVQPSDWLAATATIQASHSCRVVEIWKLCFGPSDGSGTDTGCSRCRCKDKHCRHKDKH